jgi:UDP-N-acetylglucosamine acyltransferase
MCGLNVVGLRRAGFSSEERTELKRLYQMLFRSGQKMHDVVAVAAEQFKGDAVKMMLEFVQSARRGVCSDVGAATEQGDDDSATV